MHANRQSGLTETRRSQGKIDFLSDVLNTRGEKRTSGFQKYWEVRRRAKKSASSLLVSVEMAKNWVVKKERQKLQSGTDAQQ